MLRTSITHCAIVALILGSAEAQQNAARPPVPALPHLPTDSTFTVEAPGYSRAELLYFRNIVGIIFDDTTSGKTIRDLFTRYDGTIIGGVPGVSEYIVRMPDPGPTLAAVDSLVTQIYSEPGVAIATKVYFRTPVYFKHHPKGATH